MCWLRVPAIIVVSTFAFLSSPYVLVGEEYRANDPVIADGSPEMWALACDALHSSAMHVEFNRLRWGAATKENVEHVKNGLSEGPWGVWDRTDALRRLKETLDGGHSEKFLDMGRFLAESTASERKAYIEERADDSDLLNRIEMATKLYPQLKKKGLLGWDLARSIALCRRAYTAGYIEKDEAWRSIMPIARQLQKTFVSWEDLGNNYLLGRRFWSKERADEGNPILEAEMKRLLTDKTSVWHKMPWKLNLEAAQSVKVPENTKK